MSLFSGRPDPDRIARLAQLERQIEPGLAAHKAFAAAGQALAAVRDEKLFSHKWATFGQYVDARWQITERHANRLIEAAAVMLDLGPLAESITSERQARIVAQVPAEHRPAVVTAAATDPSGSKLADLEKAAAPFITRRRKSLPKKPGKTVLKGKGWKVVIERRTRETEVAECLAQALAQVQAISATRAAA